MGKKGYENGLGAMLAEERMAVSAKSMLAAGIVREKKYAEFKSYDGMPERGTPQFNWQQNQLSDGAGSLNVKIREELAENKESAI